MRMTVSFVAYLIGFTKPFCVIDDRLNRFLVKHHCFGGGETTESAVIERIKLDD